MARVEELRLADSQSTVLWQGDRPRMASATVALQRVHSTDQAPNVSDRGVAPSPAFHEAVPTWRESRLFWDRERPAMEHAERIALGSEARLSVFSAVR
jgi:hypothetical protein